MHNALTRQDGFLQHVLLHVSQRASTLLQQLGITSNLLLPEYFWWVLETDLQVVSCKDVSKQLVELMKLLKYPSPTEISCLTCLDAVGNPIKALPCTFKHLKTFVNAFFDHLGMEGRSVSRGFVLLTHLLLTKETFGFIHIVPMSHVTFPFHSITPVVPRWRILNNSSPFFTVDTLVSICRLLLNHLFPHPLSELYIISSFNLSS